MASRTSVRAGAPPRQLAAFSAERRAGRNLVADVLVYAVLAVSGLTMIGPLVWMVATSLKSFEELYVWPPRLLPAVPMWENYAYAWTFVPFERFFVNSTVVAVTVTLGELVTSSLGGYVFARLDFPGRNVLLAFILSTTMVPFVTLLIPLYIVMMKLGVLNTYVAVWLPGAVSSFGIFLCRQFILTLPQDLDDAARIDGAGDFAIYRLIVLPLIRPVLSALAIFTFLGSFNAYLWPLVALNDKNLYTLPLILVQVSQTFGGMNYQGVMAGSVLASLPSLFVYLLFQRNFVRGIALSGLKA